MATGALFPSWRARYLTFRYYDVTLDGRGYFEHLRRNTMPGFLLFENFQRYLLASCRAALSKIGAGFRALLALRAQRLKY